MDSGEYEEVMWTAKSWTTSPSLAPGVKAIVTMGSIEQLLNYAAKHLPKGWLVRIEVENGAASVHAVAPDGREYFIDSDGDLSGRINAAIDLSLERGGKNGD